MSDERILVVDGLKWRVDRILDCLACEPFDAMATHTLEQAFYMLCDQPFDLVLIDIELPGMNWCDDIKPILALDEPPVVVVMTGPCLPPDAGRGLGLGVWDYLKRPFEDFELAKTVINGLKHKRLLSEKKAYETLLEASDKQYQCMVNNSPDLIFTLDVHNCLAFVNQQFEQVVGLSSRVLTGMDFCQLVHEDDLHRASELASLMTGQRRGILELELRLKKPADLHDRHDPYSVCVFLELKASVINLPGGAFGPDCPKIYVVGRDITERLRLEAQLRQAQKMEAIGTLAGGIAHDFNNILMGIQGYTSLVKSKFDRHSAVYKRLASIEEYVYNGAEMTRQLLGFSQKTCHETCRMNLNYLLKMSAKMFGRTKKDIIINQDLEKKLWSSNVDEGQIKQVLMNLYVNAWQAMPDGGSMTVASKNMMIDENGAQELGLKQPGPYVRISVTDQGAGMDKDTMARIFDPFFSTKERGKGTGLGLATAYGIVKSHNGAFHVDSCPGKGSVFMFYLPAASDMDPEDDVLVTHERKDGFQTGKGRVLLVDDEKGIIDVCSEMLEILGYDVSIAQSGSAALEIVKTDPSLDLIILDMIMPEMNGSETYEKIRRINEDVRVLVCSGYSNEEGIRSMMSKGCDDYLLKPFDVGVLSEKLQTLFNPRLKENV